MCDKGREDVEGDITVDEESTCPVAPHPECVAVGTCQASSLGKGH